MASNRKTRRRRHRKVRFSRRLIMGGSKPPSAPLGKEGDKGPVIVQNPLVKVPPAAGLRLTTSPPRKPKKPIKHKKPGVKKLKA